MIIILDKVDLVSLTEHKVDGRSSVKLGKVSREF